MRRIRVTNTCLLVLALGACAQRATASRSAPVVFETSGQTTVPLAADDERRALVGQWHVEFRWEAKRRTLRGTLEIRDSLVRQLPGSGIRAVLNADFAAAFAWTPPCVDATAGVVGVRLTGGELGLDFSPRCSDNNLIATGALRDGEVRGTWGTVHFAGRGPERGTFRMWRVANAPVRHNGSW